LRLPPNRYAVKLAEKLLANTSERALFLTALTEGKSARPALLWMQSSEQVDAPFSVTQNSERPPWQPEFIDALIKQQTDTKQQTERPGKHALHDAGAYYCLDLSSVFEASGCLHLVNNKINRIIDVCASPGGKSLFAARALRPETLICNETIGKRVRALNSNLRRCQITATTTSLDPSVLADDHAASADLVLVDAPCSGQSLIARGMDVPGAFHPVTVNQCAGRQKRILAESARLLAPSNSTLIYSTCTYSLEENESVIRWFLKRNEAFRAIELPTHTAHQSAHADFPCYRLWPQEGFGAGGFVCALTNFSAL
jgi:16S rRNA C967 or C1407 C5-methylase (RsmB/RsmF family)